jgi:hypothetical protein
MRFRQYRGVLACLALTAGALSYDSAAAEPMRLTSSGGIEMAGRQVKCQNVHAAFDRSLPNLGLAAPDERLLVLNPFLLGRFSTSVQLFVFHHECGHHRVGESELGADCWAAGQGVREGWLDRNGLAQVCRSFGDAPETGSHPSGQRRCANLDRCFAAAEIEVAQQRKGRDRKIKPSTPITVAAREQRKPASQVPELIERPRLLWTSQSRH